MDIKLKLDLKLSIQKKKKELEEHLQRKPKVLLRSVAVPLTIFLSSKVFSLDKALQGDIILTHRSSI